MSPRIPYVSDDIDGDIADAIRQRRGGELLELDRMLLHNPDLASGWNNMFGAIRTKTSLPASIRELCICWYIRSIEHYSHQGCRLESS